MLGEIPRKTTKVSMFQCMSKHEETRKLHGISLTKQGPCCVPVQTPDLFSYGNDKDRK